MPFNDSYNLHSIAKAPIPRRRRAAPCCRRFAMSPVSFSAIALHRRDGREGDDKFASTLVALNFLAPGRTLLGKAILIRKLLAWCLVGTLQPHTGFASLACRPALTQAPFSALVGFANSINSDNSTCWLSLGGTSGALDWPDSRWPNEGSASHFKLHSVWFKCAPEANSGKKPKERIILL